MGKPPRQEEMWGYPLKQLDKLSGAVYKSGWEVGKGTEVDAMQKAPDPEIEKSVDVSQPYPRSADHEDFKLGDVVEWYDGAGKLTYWKITGFWPPRR